jgi:hypothetical protein
VHPECGSGVTAGPGMISGFASGGNAVPAPVRHHEDQAPEPMDEEFWEELCKFLS